MTYVDLDNEMLGNNDSLLYIQPLVIRYVEYLNFKICYIGKWHQTITYRWGFFLWEKVSSTAYIMSGNNLTEMTYLWS